MGQDQERIYHFRQLRVYQQARELAKKIYAHSQEWPQGERFALTDQIRRSSRSVCANIAEAWRKRRYVAHFVSKLSDADTEAGETQSWLDSALDCGRISQTEYEILDRAYEILSGGLVKMMSDPQKWCGPANMVREDSTLYETTPEA